MPVSYTHLDVYKRQILCGILCPTHLHFDGIGYVSCSVVLFYKNLLHKIRMVCSCTAMYAFLAQLLICVIYCSMNVFLNCSTHVLHL